MTSGQLNSRIAHRTRPDLILRLFTWQKNFVANRVREAGYGAFFASVFLMCQSPANALALDDIRVLSKLGEPLVAEVRVTPAAGEALTRSCFSSQAASGDLPGVGRVRLSLSRNLDTNILRIAGSQAMREPMSEFSLQVKCPGIPTMVKTFLVMVDPPTLDSVSAPLAAASVSRSSRVAPTGGQGNRGQSVSSPITNPIEPGSRYRVQTGDMLSTIAARVAGRPDWSVWPIAQQIYANNPGAFLLGDPNVIAQDAVIMIPRLADVDMTASTARIRPADSSNKPVVITRETTTSPTVAPAAASAVKRPVAAAKSATAPATQPAATTVPSMARIMPTPAAVVIPATPLPTMQLTTRLFGESQTKILLRAQGSPVAAAVITRALPVSEVPVSSTPDPSSAPDRPDSAVTATRAVIQPGQAARAEASGLSWLWVVIGLLTGLLLGALAAVGLFRHNLRREFEHEVREGVQRQVHTDRLRLQRELANTSTGAAATMDLSTRHETVTDDDSENAAVTEPMVALNPNTDHTIEMPTVTGLDFELADAEPATVGDPETLEMPGVADDLDLELPAETSKTGQHEVDFDLLEAAYSEDYQSEFVNPGGSEEKEAADSDEAIDDSARYYHLENRDPTDESPLPIELGDDEMGDDDTSEGDGKIVRFRR